MPLKVLTINFLEIADELEKNYVQILYLLRLRKRRRSDVSIKTKDIKNDRCLREAVEFFKRTGIMDPKHNNYLRHHFRKKAKEEFGKNQAKKFERIEEA